jgi:hypothetical protein
MDGRALCARCEMYDGRWMMWRVRTRAMRAVDCRTVGLSDCRAEADGRVRAGAQSKKEEV